MVTMERETDDELAVRLRLSVTRLGRRLRSQVDDGVTPSQLSALASLARRGAMTLGDLSAVERVKPPSMTKIVASLEEAGLVSRTTDQLDRRIARVDLTVAGRRLLDTSRSRKNAYLAARLATLSPQDHAALRRAVDALEHLIEGPE